MFDLTCISEAFGKELYNLIRHNKLTKIVETGTYTGQGSTRHIVNALKILSKPPYELPVELHSIESNYENWIKASELYKHLDWVNLHCGLSISKAAYPSSSEVSKYLEFIKKKYPKAYIDNLGADGYWFEATNSETDNVLNDVLSKVKADLILLDSCGVLGYDEFRSMDLCTDDWKHTWYLALDDVAHIKHIQTCDVIEGNPDSRYKLIVNCDEKFGSKIYRVN